MQSLRCFSGRPPGVLRRFWPAGSCPSQLRWSHLHPIGAPPSRRSSPTMPLSSSTLPCPSTTSSSISSPLALDLEKRISSATTISSSTHSPSTRPLFQPTPTSSSSLSSSTATCPQSPPTTTSSSSCHDVEKFEKIIELEQRMAALEENLLQSLKFMDTFSTQCLDKQQKLQQLCLDAVKSFSRRSATSRRVCHRPSPSTTTCPQSPPSATSRRVTFADEAPCHDVSPPSMFDANAPVFVPSLEDPEAAVKAIIDCYHRAVYTEFEYRPMSLAASLSTCHSTKSIC